MGLFQDGDQKPESIIIPLAMRASVCSQKVSESQSRMLELAKICESSSWCVAIGPGLATLHVLRRSRQLLTGQYDGTWTMESNASTDEQERNIA